MTELVKPRSVASARLPDFVEPMKAKLVASMPSGDWIYEIKFDGYHALALVSQIKFTEWTRDDRLRQPVFLGLREDKNANEVVREQAS